MPQCPTLHPEGDGALIIEFACAPSPEARRLVASAVQQLKNASLPGVLDLIPAFCTIMVCYDPLAVSYGELCSSVKAALDTPSGKVASPSRLVEIPVCYGGVCGPDLADVAAHAHLSETEVVELHTRRIYTIDMLGFLPGFAYTADLDARLHTPRLATPRVGVPAGSVGIGGSQTGVYPVDSPGGWRLIGRTPVKVYDPGRPEPILYRAGDRIRFVEITQEEYARMALRKETRPPTEGPRQRASSPNAPGFTVLRAGMHDSVQDSGRYGFQDQGFSPAGFMDTRSAAIANALVGNVPEEALVECAYTGCSLRFDRPAVICVTGAFCQVELNGRRLPSYQAITVHTGDTLDLGRAANGAWGYLAVAGGIDTAPFLGSRSTSSAGSVGGIDGRKLRAGDVLPMPADAPVSLPGMDRRRLPSRDAYFPRSCHGGPVTLRVVPSGGSRQPSAAWLQQLSNSCFEVSARSDRMGIRLQGPKGIASGPDGIASEGIALGTIQVPSHGDPIVVCADHQTTGGYAKAGTVASVDMPRLVQCPPGTLIRFQVATVDEAQWLFRRDRAWLARLYRMFNR